LPEQLQKVPLFKISQFNKELLDFPVAQELCCSQIVVFHTVANIVVAACGIRRNLFNVLVLHVKNGYRNQQIGTQILQKTIDKANSSGLSFITLSVSSKNTHALHLYSKIGFKQVITLRKSNLILMLLPLKCEGSLLYLLLHGLFFVIPQDLVAHVHHWYYRKTLTLGK
jgi:GNAT superfamily N-acetyltransferase